MSDVVSFILVLISGVCWSAVYVDSIYLAFKQKTYCMPLFALGLNIAWEGLYSFTDIFIRSSIDIQAIANAAWFCLDIVILVSYFKFAPAECKTEEERRTFVPWTILALATCLVMQILFMVEFGDEEGEKYSAFIQNIIMSICYLYMLKDRGSSLGQSRLIAVCKCIGTVTPTILGTLEGNMFILVTGIICFIFDLIYIIQIWKVTAKERELAGQTTGQSAEQTA